MQQAKIFELDKEKAHLYQTYENEDKPKRKFADRFDNEALLQYMHYLGTMLCIISLSALLGHILNILGYGTTWLYKWYYDDIGMALSTSIVVMVIGLMLLIVHTILKRHDRKV